MATMFWAGLSCGALLVAILAHLRISDLQERVENLDSYVSELGQEWPQKGDAA